MTSQATEDSNVAEKTTGQTILERLDSLLHRLARLPMKFCGSTSRRVNEAEDVVVVVVLALGSICICAWNHRRFCAWRLGARQPSRFWGVNHAQHPDCKCTEEQRNEVREIIIAIMLQTSDGMFKSRSRWEGDTGLSIFDALRGVLIGCGHKPPPKASAPDGTFKCPVNKPGHPYLSGENYISPLGDLVPVGDPVKPPCGGYGVFR